jgi:hypothetical protein
MTGAPDGPEPVARAFVDAVAWAEHTRVWELLSASARLAVLGVAGRRGMDPLLAARLREGTAGVDERDEFLADLLQGIRVDLRGIDLDAVRCVDVDSDSNAGPEGSAVVTLLEDVAPEMGGPVPVGTVELVVEPGGRWAVARVRGRA